MKYPGVSDQITRLRRQILKATKDLTPGVRERILNNCRSGFCPTLGGHYVHYTKLSEPEDLKRVLKSVGAQKKPQKAPPLARKSLEDTIQKAWAKGFITTAEAMGFQKGFKPIPKPKSTNFWTFANQDAYRVCWDPSGKGTCACGSRSDPKEGIWVTSNVDFFHGDGSTHCAWDVLYGSTDPTPAAKGVGTPLPAFSNPGKDLMTNLVTKRGCHRPSTYPGVSKEAVAERPSAFEPDVDWDETMGRKHPVDRNFHPYWKREWGTRKNWVRNYRDTRFESLPWVHCPWRSYGLAWAALCPAAMAKHSLESFREGGSAAFKKAYLEAQERSRSVATRHLMVEEGLIGDSVEARCSKGAKTRAKRARREAGQRRHRGEAPPDTRPMRFRRGPETMFFLEEKKEDFGVPVEVWGDGRGAGTKARRRFSVRGRAKKENEWGLGPERKKQEARHRRRDAKDFAAGRSWTARPK